MSHFAQIKMRAEWSRQMADNRLERADGEMYRRTFKGKSVKEIRHICLHDGKPMNSRTLASVRNSDFVFYSTLRTIARRTNTAVSEWILHDDRIALPTSTDFFESLTRSYYLSPSEDADATVLWREEEIKFRYVSSTIGGLIPLTMRFRGTIRSWENHRQKIFTFIASRTSNYYFGLVANSTTNPGVSFHAIFSHVLDEALCGVWIGLSPRANRMAVYRTILSSKPLSIAQLVKLSDTAPTEREFTLLGDPGSPVVRLDDEK
ncbi:MAG TPA: hypothetical protein VFE47_07810 [Tepidisphaeraceae bacterium]|nr:hypothetical protein [Tepidisphaeraceae bacterium]